MIEFTDFVENPGGRRVRCYVKTTLRVILRAGTKLTEREADHCTLSDV
jgi:hypothetical protein